MVAGSTRLSNLATLLLFNKPFQVLSQFTDEEDRATLAHYFTQTGYYPAGRLDYDSEGLLLLTNSGRLQAHISHPKYKTPKTYWAQVEGSPDKSALDQLSLGVKLKDGLTKPAKVRIIDPPDVWSRHPPIRERKNLATSWLSLTITEGRNRQVRRMTAAVGYPTLRLIRACIGTWRLDGLQPGEWREESFHLPATYPQSKIGFSRQKRRRT